MSKFWRNTLVIVSIAAVIGALAGASMVPQFEFPSRAATALIIAAVYALVAGAVCLIVGGLGRIVGAVRRKLVDG